ncbi:MAG: hypothetical protein JO010_01730 [Alphaproteobacteria bacterium]|nr:hypothetical protein [Alphaproteobacteria bacterium]
MTVAGEYAFGALCRLDPGWQVIRNRRIAADGEQYRVQFIIMHRDFGVGLVVLSRQEYTAPEIAIRTTRAMLKRRGFDRQFRGFLPIVFVALDPDDTQAAPTQIAQAFTAAPPIGVTDAGWVEWTANAFDGLDEETADPPNPERAEDIAITDIEVSPMPPPRPSRRWRRAAARFLAVTAPLVLVASIIFGLFAFFDRSSVGRVIPVSAAINDALPKAASAAREGAPRLMSEQRAAAYLGLDVAAFREKLDALRVSGFPAPEPITGNFDRASIDRWLDRRGASE